MTRGKSHAHVAFLCPADYSYVATQWAIWKTASAAVPLSMHIDIWIMHRYESSNERACVCAMFNRSSPSGCRLGVLCARQPSRSRRRSREPRGIVRTAPRQDAFAAQQAARATNSDTCIATHSIQFECRISIAWRRSIELDLIVDGLSCTNHLHEVDRVGWVGLGWVGSFT